MKEETLELVKDGKKKHQKCNFQHFQKIYFNCRYLEHVTNPFASDPIDN